ncbi:MAG: methyltransferase domain-containing protein [bacterium]
MNADLQIKLFAKLMPYQLKLREIVRLLGATDNKVCLDAGHDNAAMSKHLRALGGSWSTLVRHEASRSIVEQAVGERVSVFDGVSMPFDDKTFDVVILSDFLERVPDDNALITECHRILKPTGRLVVDVPHSKRSSILRPIEAVIGTTASKKNRARPGYTEAELFQLLKHGFDVHLVRSYSKAFMELVDVVVSSRAERYAGGGAQEERLARLYSRAYPFYWLAFQLDALLFLTRGYNVVAVAVRHPWRPRKAPVLHDGRSITEAVLSKIRD